MLKCMPLVYKSVPRIWVRAQRTLCVQRSPANMDNLQNIRYPIKTETDLGFDLTLPGYGFADLDRFGTVQFHLVTRWIEAVRARTYYPHLMHEPEPADNTWQRKIAKDCLIFMVAARYEVLPAFYDHSHYHNLVKGINRFVNLGRSSFQHYVEGRSVINNELLHRAVISIVLTDKDSRRPIPLPEEMTAHFHGKETELKIPLAEKVLKLNKDDLAGRKSFTAVRRVYWSEIDINFHVNHSFMHKYAIDAVTEAGDGGFFTKLDGDIGHNYVIKDVKCSYLAEMKIGETFKIHIWEDTDDPFKVYIIMDKENQDVFHSTITFVQHPSFVREQGPKV